MSHDVYTLALDILVSFTHSLDAMVMHITWEFLILVRIFIILIWGIIYSSIELKV